MPEAILIQLEDVEKEFQTNETTNQVLKKINLEITQKDIFGIIGYSGAGKSTLVRCINGIEEITAGKVLVKGKDISALSKPELRTLRKKMGMIFQLFNLMPSRTVFGNVELPLKNSGLSKAEREARVRELLVLVGLSDKEKEYPAQLSGGQKQRVAIARALANNPEVLLCDEATSALDPQTTKAILKLLRELNQKLGITIVLITHEMSVVKEICHKVAIIDKGVILEQGDVFSVFSNPQKALTKSFIETTSNLKKVDELLRENSEIVALEPGQILIKIQYQDKHVSEALISAISKKFGIDANIISGDIEIIDEYPLGGLVAILDGEQEQLTEAITFLESKQIKVEVLKDGRVFH